MTIQLKNVQTLKRTSVCFNSCKIVFNKIKFSELQNEPIESHFSKTESKKPNMNFPVLLKTPYPTINYEGEPDVTYTKRR